MVAKTFQGLEGVLSDELRRLGAENVTEGRRMVSFEGDKEMMYRANFCCRTALRILKPFYKFHADDADRLYSQVKQLQWENILKPDSTFLIDATVNSENFRHSQFVTYRIKDAIADYFSEKYGKRPSIRLNSPDFVINAHINGDEVTLSLDSSGEPLYKRGWRAAQTDAPINEVLAAGIILLSGWDGNSNFVDPMCGSGTFLIEAALIAANINPGVFRKNFAFQQWADYDEDLFNKIYNDDSSEREFKYKIYGSDILGKAIAITQANIKNAGLGKYIEVERRDIADITEAPHPGILITNPPYGQRLKPEEIESLYSTLGTKLKHVFTGYNAWVIGYNKELISNIGLKASVHYPLLNGSLECELRQYVIFDGTYDNLRHDGGSIKNDDFRASKDKKSLERREFKPTFNGDHPRRSDSEHRHTRRDEHRKPQPRPDRDENGRIHNETIDRRIVRFRTPQLGEENERKIIRGRRKSWKRRDIDNNEQ